MKTRRSSFKQVLWLVCSVIFVALFIKIDAQSVKVSKELKPASTRSSKHISQEHLENKRKTVVNANGDDKYEVLFRTSYEGKLGGYLLTETKEINRASYTGLNNFIEHLDEAGKRGYRIISSLTAHRVAIVSFDETHYEYKWFETTGSVHFAKSGLNEKINELSELGFRLIEHSQLYTWCEYRDSENLALGENCSYSDLFLFERAKKVKKPTEQILINTFPGWGARPSVEIAGEIDKKLAEGFYPVKAISKFEILLEKATDKNNILEDKPDVQIIRSDWGTGDLEKRVNELAMQGYRLGVINNGIAIMYRNSETNGKPVLYIWLRADKKKFEKELAKLQQARARYAHVYPDQHGIKNSLIFESNLAGKSKGAEFKVLEFDFDKREDKNAGKVYVKLTSLAESSIKTMNELAKQGFVVRDLFEGDKVSVILERVR